MILVLGYHVQNYIVDFLIIKSRILSQILTNKLTATRLKTKYYILIWEFTYIFMMIFMIYYGLIWINSTKNGLVLLAFSVTTIIFGEIGRLLIQKYPRSPSLIKLIKEKGKHSNYFIYRFNLFFNCMINFWIWIYLLVTILYIFFHLEWYPNIYFIGFMVIPICFNVWIYAMSKGEADDAEFNIKKFIIYLVLCIVAVLDSYERFQVLIASNLSIENDIQRYLVATTIAIFTAIERLVKSLLDDYKLYKVTYKSMRRI